MASSSSVCDRAVGVCQSGVSYGRRGQADHERVGVPGCARAGCEPLEPSGNLCCGTTKCVDARLGAAYVQQVARCLDLEPRGEPVSASSASSMRPASISGSILVSVIRSMISVSPQAAAKADPGVELVECRLGPFVGPQQDAEVVVEDADFAALSGFGRQPDCLAHVVDATRHLRVFREQSRGSRACAPIGPARADRRA